VGGAVSVSGRVRRRRARPIQKLAKFPHLRRRLRWRAWRNSIILPLIWTTVTTSSTMILSRQRRRRWQCPWHWDIPLEGKSTGCQCGKGRRAPDIDGEAEKQSRRRHERRRVERSVNIEDEGFSSDDYEVEHHWDPKEWPWNKCGKCPRWLEKDPKYRMKRTPSQTEEWNKWVGFWNAFPCVLISERSSWRRRMLVLLQEIIEVENNFAGITISSSVVPCYPYEKGWIM